MSFIGVQCLFVDKRRTILDINTDASNQIILGGPCFYCTYKCKGFYQHTATLARHAKKYFEERTKELEEGSGVQLLDCPYISSLYEERHAEIPLHEGTPITVLDYVFLQMRKFVAHPCHTKVSVTENFRCEKLSKLPKPSNASGSYEEAKNVIKEFLTPLQKYDACPKDCVNLRKTNDVQIAVVLDLLMEKRRRYSSIFLLVQEYRDFTRMEVLLKFCMITVLVLKEGKMTGLAHQAL